MSLVLFGNSKSESDCNMKAQADLLWETGGYLALSAAVVYPPTHTFPCLVFVFVLNLSCIFIVFVFVCVLYLSCTCICGYLVLSELLSTKPTRPHFPLSCNVFFSFKLLQLETIKCRP